MGGQIGICALAVGVTQGIGGAKTHILLGGPCEGLLPMVVGLAAVVDGGYAANLMISGFGSIIV